VESGEPGGLGAGVEAWKAQVRFQVSGLDYSNKHSPSQSV
jgi:hypothetical protein